MSNAQGHLIAGTLSSLILALFLYHFAHISFLVLFLGVILGIVASEFPDIDHPKSLPRKIIRGIMPATIIFVFVYLFFDWRMWTKNVVLISLFFGAPFLIIFSYEYFIPKHRGAMHKWPGMATMVVLSISFSLVVGFGFISLLILTAFAVLGFSTHILLDHL